MLKLLSNLIFSGCFYLSNYFLKEQLSKHHNPIYQQIPAKISRNMTCFSHACLSLFLSAYYQMSYHPSLFYLMTGVSSGYFLFDLYYIIKYDPITTLNMVFLYHHLVSLYILNKGPEYQIYKILFWAELSNIPMYIVYHYLKTDPHGLQVQIWKQIQKYSYLTIRIPILGYYTYQSYFLVDDKIPFYVCLPVYLMGIAWSIILFNKKKITI